MREIVSEPWETGCELKTEGLPVNGALASSSFPTCVIGYLFLIFCFRMVLDEWHAQGYLTLSVFCYLSFYNVLRETVEESKMTHGGSVGQEILLVTEKLSDQFSDRFLTRSMSVLSEFGPFPDRRRNRL